MRALPLALLPMFLVLPEPTALGSETEVVQLQAMVAPRVLPPQMTQYTPTPAPVDVIDDALWARFAGHNGEPWWLHAKVIKDGQGHTQLDNAKYIVERFRAAGLPDSLALAAVANSLMESSLLSDRVHPDSKATGLFQCWRNPRVQTNLPGGGAGNGTPGFDWGNGDGVNATIAQMKDRDLNTDRILFELMHVENTTGKEFFGVPAGESFGGPILERARAGASVAELAAMWGQRIERYRPSPNGTYAFRGRVAARLFGEELAYAETTGWRMNTLPEAPHCPAPTLMTGTTLEHRSLPAGAWVPIQPGRGVDTWLDVWKGWGEPAPGCP